MTSSLKLITLPSALEEKRTKPAEKEAKKRKASAPPTIEPVKKLKTTPLFSVVPIDATPISAAAPTRTIEDLQIVPYGVEYVIPPADENEEEDTHSAATTE